MYHCQVLLVFMCLCSSSSVCGSAWGPRWDLWENCDSELLGWRLPATHHRMGTLQRYIKHRTHYPMQAKLPATRVNSPHFRIQTHRKTRQTLVSRVTQTPCNSSHDWISQTQTSIQKYQVKTEYSIIPYNDIFPTNVHFCVWQVGLTLWFQVVCVCMKVCAVFCPYGSKSVFLQVSEVCFIHSWCICV